MYIEFMKNNTPITFEKNPNLDMLTQTFAWWRYFSEESLAFHLPIFPQAKFLVATIQWKTVGAIMYLLVSDAFDKKVLIPCFIEVIPNFRDKKIGTRLLHEVEELYKWEISQISASITWSDWYSQKMFMSAWFQAIDDHRYIKNSAV